MTLITNLKLKENKHSVVKCYKREGEEEAGALSGASEGKFSLKRLVTIT